MTQKQVEITRRHDIVVASVSTNLYGDLEFTDTEGGSYKVGANRINFFKDIILPQRAVRLNWAKNPRRPTTEYIYNAVPAEQLIKAKESAARELDRQVDEKEPAVKPTGVKDTAIPLPRGEGEARGMVTKELGDMIRSKNLKTLFGEEIAFELVKWYRSQILGITRVPFDGAKLPEFEKRKEE